jgi:hypothetical protein
MFRLEALVRFISEEELPGWIHNDQSDGSVMTHEGLITAAGQCPIRYRQKHFRFNRKALLRLAFQFAKTARRP